MGCTSSKEAAGEAPMRKGPTQEEMLRANSPQAPSSPANAQHTDPTHNRSPSVLPIPIMPVLASEVDARSSVLPPPPSLPSPRSAAPPPPSFSTLVTPFNPSASLPIPSPSSPDPTLTLPLPQAPPSLASISRSAPFPLPPVKPGHSRLLSATIKPRDLPTHPDAATSPSPSIHSTLPDPLKWTPPLPPLTDTNSPKGSARGSAAVSRQPSFNSLLATASPSLNLMDPTCTSTRIGDTFTHYAHKRYEERGRTTSPRTTPADEKPAGDDEVVDKKALGQLATDCVLSFLLTLRLQHAGKWKDDKSKDKKERELRVKFIPGGTLEEAVEFARMYLQQELQAKRGEISRSMFFYHFARCFKAMFVYEKLTVEREALVAKWNAMGRQRLEERKKGEGEGEGGEGREGWWPRH